MPLISVIVPVYKVESYLSRCVNSILGQTFTDFELILVDDGSPDRCGIMCDEFAENDSRIHVIHRENGGLSAARNTGIDWTFANSDSQYLNFIDSDDWVHPQYLELLWKAVSENDADLSQCMFLQTSDVVQYQEVSGRIVCVSPEEQFLNWYCPFAWGKLYKKSSFSSLRYPVGLLFEDVAIWYMLLFSLNRIAVVDEKLYYYFQRTDGITRSNWIPAKLAQVDAWDTQIQYYKKMGNTSVLREALKRACWVYERHYKEIDDSLSIGENEKRIYKKKLLKRFRTLLYENKDELSVLGLYKHYLWFTHPLLNKAKQVVKGSLISFRGKEG